MADMAAYSPQQGTLQAAASRPVALAHPIEVNIHASPLQFQEAFLVI